MSFEQQIQEWVTVDSKMKNLMEEMKELRNKRNNLETNITNYASVNNLSSSTIKISDGKLKFVNTKVVEPLTFKYLEKVLGDVIKNPSQVELIMNHLKQKRSIKINPEIKRLYNN